MSKRRGPRPGYGLPPVEEKVRNLAGQKIHFVEEWGVYEWHRLPDGQGPPEAVAFHMKTTDGMELAMPIGSPEALDQLINMLIRHRLSVWPDVPVIDEHGNPR